MYIFYDFETSQKDFLGQILSYYFVLVDETFQPIQECQGLIQPNRLELPACGAIQVNQLSINDCIQHGQPEFEAANTVYDFLQTATNAHGHIPLVGFNSARFDFKHLEKLLLKHGLSPTFYGKISSLDIYQFSRHCAIHHSDTFPFTRKKQMETESFSFRLEDLATAFDCLDTPQTHDAKDDVLLTIELTKKLEQTFNTTLKEFYTQQHDTAAFNAPNCYLKEPVLPFEQPNQTPIIHYNEWLVIGKASKTTYILLDVNAYHNQSKDSFSDYSTITKYYNSRANAMHCSTHPQTDAHVAILNDPNIQKITANALQYFKLFPVDWDIEYRPWAMGFDTIPTLRTYIERLHKHPDDYNAIIKEWQGLKASTPNKAQEFNFMITLFNRFYLNHHPNPKPEHIQKYIQPRYVSGAMHRNIADQITPTTEKNTIEFHLTTATPGSREHTVLSELNDYTKQFIGTYMHA
ncbi:MAG: hypothetical protein ACON35_02560 [Candidatus Marinamargulisbacteria bacterium]